MSEYPSDDQENILSSAFHTDRKDIYIAKKLLKNIFKRKLVEEIELPFLEKVHINYKDF